MNVSIRTKFIGIIALQAAANILVGWQGIAGINEMNMKINSIYEHQFIPSRIISDANSDLIAWNRAILNFLLAEDAEKSEEYVQIVNKQKDTVLRDFESLSARETLTQQEARMLVNIQKELQRAIPIQEHLLILSREGRTAEAQETLHSDFRPIVDTMDTYMAAFLDIQESQMLEARKVAEDLYHHDLNRILLTVGGVFIISFLLNLLITHSIIGSIRQLLKGAGQFGRGNLDYRIPLESGDEIQELASALNSMATERKIAENSLRNSTEELRLFAYSIVHDLKSPAVGIHGLTGLLHRGYRNVLDQRGERLCDQIMKASEQVVALVEEVNTYITTKEMPVNIEEINSQEIFRMVREEFSTQLGIRRIEHSWPESEPLVRADRLALLRVFRNLLDNALKYGGERLSKICIRCEESADFHIFSVSDNGAGLKTEHPERLFTVFQRHETSKGVDGTGLGLAIVKEIAEKHRGEVWAEPGAQGGVTFFITISKKL